MSARSSPSPSFSAGINRQNVSLKNTGLAMSQIYTEFTKKNLNRQTLSI